METPKPAPFKKPVPKNDEKPATVKRPFVRSEHLTSKPFRENQGLRELQSKLNKEQRRKPNNPKAQRQR